MWSNFSSLAQKAKEAAAHIEEQINDSMGTEYGHAHVGEAGVDAASNDDDGHAGAARGSDGWEKCDDISDGDGEDEKEKAKPKQNMPQEATVQEMSFVDLKSAADSIPTAGSGRLESNDALLDALDRIESLEKQVSRLKVELASAREAAREESENYHATNLLLGQQVKELQEENKILKEKANVGKK